MREMVFRVPLQTLIETDTAVCAVLSTFCDPFENHSTQLYVQVCK